MAPVVFPVLFSHVPHELANSTFSIKQRVSQTSPVFSASFSSSTISSKPPVPTVTPYLIHQQFSTIIIGAPTTSYTSYVELSNNAFNPPPTSLSDSKPIGDPYTVAAQAPQPSNSGRDIGIVTGCIVGVLILGLIGWVYMMKAKQSQRKRRKVKAKVEVKAQVKRRKHRKHRKHRKTEEKAPEDTGGDGAAAEEA
ncbi:hypothetical protein DSL72_008503 [Monilinia vaccinii-corymbosi]|uniref:Uncharacterized protein n=1 Tax=Monilinia vaccinii-corymbosi TaxID=61207 RepID=A0A8A3PKU5_9HELO|nr:hypothetical protein DSL72_008503 [Monilinia vaccinii-corymbosi]